MSLAIPIRIMLGGGRIQSRPELPRELKGCTVALDLREAIDQTRSIYMTPQSD